MRNPTNAQLLALRERAQCVANRLPPLTKDADGRLSPASRDAFEAHVARVLRQNRAVGAALVLRAQAPVFFAQGAVILMNMLTQSMGQTLRASLIATSRQGTVFLPLLLLLPRFFGKTGLLLAQPASDLVSLPLCLLLTRGALKGDDRAASPGKPSSGQPSSGTPSPGQPSPGIFPQPSGAH